MLYFQCIQIHEFVSILAYASSIPHRVDGESDMANLHIQKKLSLMESHISIPYIYTRSWAKALLLQLSYKLIIPTQVHSPSLQRSKREMAGEEVSSESITLESTPTWAVATVCFVLIFISILIEHLLHLLAKVNYPILLYKYIYSLILYNIACKPPKIVSLSVK